jgi:hypothetical protein
MIYEIKKVQLNPTDVIVIKFKNIVPNATMEKVRAEYTKIFPNHKIIVMSAQLELNIIETKNEN